MVSAVGIGCNAFSRRVDLAGVRDVLDAAQDVGVTLLDTADVYGDPPGGSEELLGRGARGPPRRLRAGDQVRHGHARRERRRLRRPGLAPLRAPRGRGQPAPAAHRPRRPLPAARAGRRHAVRGDPGRADRAGAGGQGPLPRRLQHGRLAGRARRLDGADRGPRALRQRAEPLLAARPLGRGRGRAGVRGARAGHPAVLPARVRPAHRQVPPRRGRPHRLAGRPRPRPCRLARARRLGPDRGAGAVRRGARRRRCSTSRSRAWPRSRPSAR